MFARFFALLFIFLTSVARGQPAYDSLLRLAQRATDDSTRAWLINEASISIREMDADRAMQLAQEAQRVARKLNFKKGLAAALNNIGWINYRQGLYSEALALSTEALKIVRERMDATETSNTLNNIGAINFEQKKYREALQAFKEAYQQAAISSDRVGMSRSLNNIAFAFLRLGALDSARFYTMQSINSNLNDPFRSSFSLRMLGDIAFEEGNIAEALRQYNKCLEGAWQQQNNFLIASTQFRTGKALVKMGQIDRAINVLLQNVQLTARYKYKSELQETYGILSDAYKARNDYLKAMEYQRMHFLLKDSLAEQRRGAMTELIESRYDSDLKNAQIELLTKDSALKENELKAQRLLMSVGTAILVLLAVLIFNLVRSNHRNKKTNKLLSEQNELINSQSVQLEVLNKTKDKILSIVSHDMRSPMAGLKGLVNLIGSDSITQQEFIEVSKDLRKNLDYVSTDLDNLLHWANAQVKGVKPQFEHVNVQEVLVEKVNLFSEVCRNKSVKLELNVPNHLVIWADINHFGMVLRNLIGNAIKFSYGQSRVLISAWAEAGAVAIQVKDFGVGMSEEELNRLFTIENHFTKVGTQSEKGVGLGLILVKEFVETNKANIFVESKIGEGTAFTLRMQPAGIE